MATTEQTGILTYVDENGDLHLLYPVTNINAVDGLEDALSGKATTATYKGTLLASGWSSAAPFTQEITVDGVLSTDYPFVDIDLSDVADAPAVTEGWNLVDRCTVSADNTVIAYCYEEAPAVDIPIIFKVVR